MIVVVTVRSASTRLPNKCFLDMGGMDVITHVIKRCIEFGFEPVVSTTVDDRDIIEKCRKLGVRSYAGSSIDKLVRWRDTCDALSIDRFVTVDCDDPFFDATLTRKSFNVLESCDDRTICSPDMDAYLGSMGWGVSHAVVDLICSVKTTNNTEMIWKHFPDTLSVKQIWAQAHPIEKDLRLTLDYEEDYWLLRTVLRELGRFCSREDIIDFFKANQGLSLINGFRNLEWKLRQNV